MSSFIQKAEVAALESFDSAAHCPGDILKKCIKEVEDKAPFYEPVRLEMHLQSRRSQDGNDKWQVANATEEPECSKALAGDILKRCIEEVEEKLSFCGSVCLEIDLQATSGLDGNSKQQKANTTQWPEWLPTEYLRDDGSECNPTPDDVSECSTADIPAESGIHSDSDPDEAQKPGVNPGSQKHYTGECRPCGFFYHKGGCGKGLECNFCHLCPPGSIERKRKDKRQENKALKRQQARANAIQVDAAVAFCEASARRAFMAAASANAAAVTLRSYMEAY